MGKLLTLGVFTIILAAIASAQSEVGGASLNGAVLDPSGAAVIGAKIKATNAKTGFTRDSATTDAGFFAFAALPVGDYDLTIEANGFKTTKRTGISLAIGSVATVNVQLEIGTATESVNVTAEVNLVETSRSQTSTVVDDKQVADLPINGRNFLDFTLLTPAVVRDPTRGGDLAFAGQRGTSNSLLVDGSYANN